MKRDFRLRRLPDCADHNKFLSDYASIRYFACDSSRPRNFRPPPGLVKLAVLKRSQPSGFQAPGIQMKSAAAQFHIAGGKTPRAYTSHLACNIARYLHAAPVGKGRRSPIHLRLIPLEMVFPEPESVHAVRFAGAISSIPTSCRIPGM